MSLSGGITLAFSAWSFGGYYNWSLFVLFWGGMATFLVAVLPFPSRSSKKSITFFKRWRNLLRFPGVWFGLFFLGYLLLQASNPAVKIVTGAGGWWVEAIPPPLGVNFPISVQSDFTPMNAYRVLVIFSAAFSTALGLSIGLRRRAAVVFVLWAFVLSGSLMAFVAIVQHFTDAKAILWFVPSPNRFFWGTFFYRNHSVAFLNLVLTVICFLYFYHAHRSSEKGNASGPHFLLFFLALLVFGSVCLALSRGGIVFSSIVMVVFICLTFMRSIFRVFGRESNNKGFTIGMLVLTSGLSVFALSRINFEAIEGRFGNIEDSIEGAKESTRYYLSIATLDMAEDQLMYGWGAGSFRYIFPMYKNNYAKLQYVRYDYHLKKRVGWLTFQHAHNDIFQFLSEYGIVGCTLLVCFFGSFGIGFFAVPEGARLSALIFFVGVTTALGHALIDFIFNNPAYWVAFCSVIAASSRLLRLERLKLLKST